MAPIHQTFTVRHIRGREKVLKQLANMGVQIGREIMVVSESDGNMIIRVAETRIAISKELARKIII